MSGTPARDVKHDPKTVYHGPHPCHRCGGMVCTVAADQGGQAYDYPAGPIYPNSEFPEHRCAGAMKEEDGGTLGAVTPQKA